MMARRLGSGRRRVNFLQPIGDHFRIRRRKPRSPFAVALHLGGNLRNLLKIFFLWILFVEYPVFGVIQPDAEKTIVAVVHLVAVGEAVGVPRAEAEHAVGEIAGVHDLIALFRPAEVTAVDEIF